MNKLIAHLPVPDQQPSLRMDCWVVSTDGMVDVAAMGLDEITVARFAEVVVVIPVQAISWHRVALPPKVRLQDPMMVSVLLSLLEDALLGTPENMHFALSPDAKAGTFCTVAVCNKLWLASWLQALEVAGLKVSRILPQVAPDAVAAAGICTGSLHDAWVTFLRDETVVTLPLVPGVSHDQNLEAMTALPAAHTDAQAYAGAMPVNLTDHAAFAHALLQTRWDLSQFAFSSTPLHRWRRKLAAGISAVSGAPAWRSVRWAAMTVVVAGVLGTGWQAWTLNRLVQEKRQAIAAHLEASFPHVRVVLDAPLQMEQELQRLRHAVGILKATDLEPMLAAAGAALKGSVVPQYLRYSGTSLIVGGLNEAGMQMMESGLKGSGYRAVRRDTDIEIVAEI